jgi:putative transposase
LEIRKTIVCCIFHPTKRKEELLDEINDAWFDMVKIKKPYRDNRSLHPEIYSRYCSHASMAKNANQPIYLDSTDMLKINTETKFAGIIIKPRVRIWCPLRTKQTIEGKICDSKLMKRDNHFELHLTVSKEYQNNSNPSSILSVDLGEKVIATSVILHNDHFCISKHNPKPIFMGRKVRGLRRHYAYLRKKLGEKKLLKIIKKVGNTEKRKINAILHKISKDIVTMAKKNNSIILIGDLTGIRNNTKTKGRRINRIVANMPFYKLTELITYKANWQGIPVLTTKEWYSSKTCSKCNSDNTTRPYQGLFRCNCGYSCNADYNGAKNLGKRLWKYIFHDGAIVNLLKTPAFFKTGEASELIQR